MQLVLASSSRARLATLRAAGLQPVAIRPEIDETARIDESVTELACRLARQKGESVLRILRERDLLDRETVLLACDTMLEFEGRTYGKPGTKASVISRWMRMRGRQGVVHTGHYVAVIRGGRITESTREAVTVLSFADLTEQEIADYAATGEPEAVAGGFTIDSFGGPFITRIEGDPHNVVGLSLPLVRQILLDLGVAWFDLWPVPPGTQVRG
ncbi:MAG: septum formation protein Maf [Propionibacteriaceae bacterium]|jgi:septum formation protein|uniref:Nucleoside triphosphate pyrophosphatase n=1 Tax=Propionibacterium ruminifibrarum TaxID=1962131 RepID=A0A375I3B0_9ACTN|nr:nucleoside triphosphate pyrophosphatase [Propionibacterium ruminifibrarum]MBE6477082.1 septum formation protein Maf [Propionibacteriaceae bacterium]SPF67702.1 nucleoside-triphosphate diphosphatase [Propionibacterium ruminifibrarum]